MTMIGAGDMGISDEFAWGAKSIIMMMSSTIVTMTEAIRYFAFMSMSIFVSSLGAQSALILSLRSRRLRI